jgi:6-phosphogluconolactonase (cycloisomerase 2 family)
MKRAHIFLAILSLAFLLAAGCANNPTSSTSTSGACTQSSTPEASYALTGYAVSMYTVNSCTGQFTATTPASVGTGYAYPQNDSSEQLVADPLGRFVYVANLVSNVAGPSSISMYTVNSTTGVLTPTTPATVSTGWFPQGIAVDPQGRFVYTANSDDGTVSMFTINQTTGVLSPTTPASVPVTFPGSLISSPGFLAIDPTGKFLYTATYLSEGAAVFMYTINQTTGVLTPTTPATVDTGGSPFQILVAPNGKWAYVVNNLNFTTFADGVYQYTLNPTTGVLTPNNPAAAVAGNGPTEIAIDPTSSFAYVVNRGDNTVSMYTIDPVSGDLTLHSTTTNPSGTIATGEEPFRIDFDPSGKFVYVTNEGSAASIYTVNGDGTLNNTGATGVGSGSVSTAFTTLSK